MSKLNPSLEHDSQVLDTKLANEGYTRGTDEYNRQMDLQNKNAEDARTSAILGAGQYGQQLQGMDLAQGQFANQAYGQQVTTDAALRDQPINEISTLMNGGQVSLPQFQGYQGGQVANTPIGDYYMQNAQMANQNYQQQVGLAAQQNAALYGAIGNVAGMGLYGGLKMSDRRVKTDIQRIGEWLNGLPIYLFRFIGQPLLHIGFMAQDVEKFRPEAVVEINGIKHVNYALAMRS
jgi:hypothetical protein